MNVPRHLIPRTNNKGFRATFKKGYMARMNKMLKAANPHEVEGFYSERFRYYWNMGWETARKEERKDG